MIGDKIRELREKHKMTQVELAKLAGISNTYLSDIERGRVNPSLKTLDKLAKALGIKIDWEIFLSDDYAKTEQTA